MGPRPVGRGIAPSPQDRRWNAYRSFNGSAARGPRYRPCAIRGLRPRFWLQWVRGPWAAVSAVPLFEERAMSQELQWVRGPWAAVSAVEGERHEQVLRGFNGSAARGP